MTVTDPRKPYIFRLHGFWYVQWNAGVGVRRLRSTSFGQACERAAAVRRWQLEACA